MSSVNYSERIPNNVNLADDRRLRRALEHWQPAFIDWWREMGPIESTAHDVYLRTHRPALVDVSGARSLSGPDRKVRISAILKGDTGYPSSLSGTDQLTGRRFWFPRWDLGRSSGGWLGATDLVEIPLMQAGKYELIFRAHANETTRTPQTQVSLGVFELTPGGATTTTVELPSQQVVDALQQLDRKWQQQQEQRSGAPRQRSRD